MKKVTVTLNELDWQRLIINGTLDGITYVLKKVHLDDDFLKDDEIYQTLKKNATKAYKEREDYLFNKTYNQK